jgi:hypothetical protein
MTYRKFLTRGLLVGLAMAALAGCEGVEPDPDSPVGRAQKRGADYAWDHDFKLVTDCGALADMDERNGCAKWVNNRDD